MSDLYVNSISFDLGSGQINNPTQESGEVWYDNTIQRFRYAVDNSISGIRKFINEIDLKNTSGDIINEINSGIVSGSLPSSRFSISTDAGSIQNSLVTLPFDREDLANSIASNNNGEITVNESGLYLISIDVTIDEFSGNNRTEYETLLELNSSFVDGTIRKHYSRNNNQGASSASINITLDLVATDVLRIRSIRSSGSSTGWWIADGSSLTITRLTGIKGDPGPPGSGGGNVDSVNSQTGVVVLDTDDISEGSNNLYYDDLLVSVNPDVSANTTHRNQTNNPHNVTKAQVGLSNVDNIQQIPLSEKGIANGVATLDSGGKVPSAQLPSFVDDVLEFANLASFPVTGETAKIYVALDTNKTYRWSGSAYVEISSSDVNSVNGQTGNVVLDADDIAETASRIWFTPAEETKLADIEPNAKDDQNANEVPFSNSGSDLISTNVEAALKEVNTKANRQPDIVLMQVFS